MATMVHLGLLQNGDLVVNFSSRRTGSLANTVFWMVLLVDKKVEKISKPTVAIKHK